MSKALKFATMNHLWRSFLALNAYCPLNMWFCQRVMSQKDADEMANSVDPHQTATLCGYLSENFSRVELPKVSSWVKVPHPGATAVELPEVSSWVKVPHPAGLAVELPEVSSWLKVPHPGALAVELPEVSSWLKVPHPGALAVELPEVSIFYPLYQNLGQIKACLMNMIQKKDQSRYYNHFHSQKW